MCVCVGVGVGVCVCGGGGSRTVSSSPPCPTPTQRPPLSNMVRIEQVTRFVVVNSNHHNTQHFCSAVIPISSKHFITQNETCSTCRQHYRQKHL